MKTTIGALLAAIGIAACASSSPEAARRALVGEIHIKGNEPFPMVILDTDDKTSWELIGVPIADARTLNGRRVHARGTILRPPGSGTWLPSLQVSELPEPVAPSDQSHQ